MELILSLAIGVLAGSGVWLLLRPRTFQVVLGLAMMSYAVNLFIFVAGRLAVDQAPMNTIHRLARSPRLSSWLRMASSFSV